MDVYDETYENYKLYVNPTLARVMKVSGSPVEVRAQGCTIWDQNGKAYLDFAGGYGVFTLGHRHPKVVAAVKAQLDLMALSGKTMFNIMLGRASKRLAQLAPGDLQISFFCNSGTEAVEGAIKLARAATKRRSIGATRDAFHGKTLGSLSASGGEYFKDSYAPLLEDVVHLDYGSTADLEDALRDAAALVSPPVVARHDVGFLIVPVNNAEALAALAPDMEKIAAVSEQLDVVGYYVFAPGSGGVDATVRMFAPAFGIPEESATGMAAGLLTAYLYDQGGKKQEAFVIEQGLFMIPASPSVSRTRPIVHSGVIEQVWVGGHARVRETREISLEPSMS